MGSSQTRTNKVFLRNLWDAVPLIDLADPFAVLATRTDIRRAVNAYMGMLTKFYYLTLNVTMPVADGAKAVASQRWHRDPEDKKMCKVFLYLTDVDESAGPFTYIKGSHWSGRWGSVARPKPFRGGPSPEELERTIPRDDWLAATAPAGTIIFCDTSGIHRGGYATKKERIMFTAGYCSRASAWPWRYRRPDNFDEQVARMSDLTLRYAFQPYRAPLTTYFFRTVKKNFKYEG